MKIDNNVVIPKANLIDAAAYFSESDKKLQIDFIRKMLKSYKERTYNQPDQPSDYVKYFPYRKYVAFWLEFLGCQDPIAKEFNPDNVGMLLPPWIGDNSYHQDCRDLFNN